MASKKDPVDTVVSALRAKHGKESVTRLGADAARCEVEEVIPTGLSVLDHHVLGVGGLAVGRISELYSEEGAGKTSLMLHCLAAAQREGGLAILAETESALDLGWARVHGIDLDRLVLIEAECLEDTTARIEHAIRSIPKGVGPSLVGWDSIAATPMKREITETKVDGSPTGERGRILSGFCRELAGSLKRHRTHLMFVNQIRDRIGVMFGDKYTTPGGHAVKFHATIRFQLFSGKAHKKGALHVAREVTVLAAKNKLWPPWRKAKLLLDYGAGFDEQWSTITHAKDLKLIEPKRRGEKAYADAMAALDW